MAYTVHTPDNIGRKKVFDFPQRWRGENKKIGLFMACGAGIKQGVRVEGVSILDLAPTILHVAGVPVPQDMEGKVLTEIFREGSDLAGRDTEYQQAGKTEEERERVREALKHLKA